MDCKNCTSGYLKNPFRKCEVVPLPEEPTNKNTNCNPVPYLFHGENIDEDFNVIVEEGRISTKICDEDSNVGILASNDGKYFGFKLYAKMRDSTILLRTDGNLCEVPILVDVSPRIAQDLAYVNELEDNGYVLVLQNNFLYKARMSLIRKYLSEYIVNHTRSIQD